jgi:leucyl aminopeptidase (aminopeptidase T)
MMYGLDKALAIAVRDCLAVKKNETVLVVTDDAKKDIGEALYRMSKRFARESLLMLMPQRSNHGQEPPSAVARAMLEADAIFLVTRMSLSHTQARRAANAKGARIASMPGITEDMIQRTLNVDYHRIKRLGERISKIVSGAPLIRITTRLGTDLTFSGKGRKAHPDTGVITFRGGFTNLPAGEVYLAPVEGTAQGRLVIDGAIAGMWPLKRPIEVAIAKGYAVGVGPGSEAARLWKLLSVHGRQAFNVAEFGIGTNHQARLTGKVLEDEKVLGTIHIAFGDNSTMGGRVKVPSHQDGIVTRPTVWIGGSKLMEDGRLLAC